MNACMRNRLYDVISEVDLNFETNKNIPHST
jgi:hypothetical protein